MGRNFRIIDDDCSSINSSFNISDISINSAYDPSYCNSYNSSTYCYTSISSTSTTPLHSPSSIHS